MITNSSPSVQSFNKTEYGVLEVRLTTSFIALHTSLCALEWSPCMICFVGGKANLERVAEGVREILEPVYGKLPPAEPGDIAVSCITEPSPTNDFPTFCRKCGRNSTSAALTVHMVLMMWLQIHSSLFARSPPPDEICVCEGNAFMPIITWSLKTTHNMWLWDFSYAP